VGRAHQYSAGGHDLGAEGGEFEHRLIADALDLAGIGDDARVGGVDAVHIGVDLADLGADGGGDGDCAGVAAAAAEGGDVALIGGALEAGDDDDAAAVEFALNAIALDGADTGAGVDG